MVKVFYYVAAMLLLAATSCSSDSENSVVTPQTSVPVTVRVDGFTQSLEDFSGSSHRAAQSVESYSNVKAITLAFYDANGVEQCKMEQLRDDHTTYTSFGEFSCSLPIGSYTLVAIARGLLPNDVFTLNSAVEAVYGGSTRETFAGTKAVVINSTSAQNQNISLNRVCAKLVIETSDVRPAGIAKVRTTYGKGSKTFSPTTGFATDNNGFVIVNTPSAAVGSTITIGSYAFLTDNTQTMDITLETLDADDNVVFSQVVHDVPFKRNRVTKLRGALFSASVAPAIQLETSWEDEEVVNF
jgi:uncharacterized protein YcfL